MFFNIDSGCILFADNMAVTSFNLTPLDDARTTDGSSAVVLIIIFSFLVFLVSTFVFFPVWIATLNRVEGHFKIRNLFHFTNTRVHLKRDRVHTETHAKGGLEQNKQMM